MLTAPSTNGHAEAAIDTGEQRTLDLDLDPPIEFNGKSYAVLHLEEPTGRMIERAEQELSGPVNVHTLRKYQFAIVSLASSAPRGVIEQMRISQIEEAASFLASFTGGGRQTGETL